MGLVKISQLTAALSVIDNYLIETELAGGQSRHITIQQVREYFQSKEGMEVIVSPAYADIATRNADQVNVVTNKIVEVTDASADTLVNNGKALYQRTSIGWELLFAENPVNTPGNKYDAAVAPTVNNDINDPLSNNGIGFNIGSKWVDTISGIVYMCIDPTNGAAEWVIIGGGANGLAIQDNGTPVTPRPNLNLIGFDHEDDAGNDASIVKARDLIKGAVNKDNATYYVFGGNGKADIDAIATNAFKFEQDATNAITSISYSVRTGFATLFESITYANLVNFLNGTFATPGEAYSVGIDTNWEVRVDALMNGASVPSKDFKITFIINPLS